MHVVVCMHLCACAGGGGLFLVPWSGFALRCQCQNIKSVRKSAVTVYMPACLRHWLNLDVSDCVCMWRREKEKGRESVWRLDHSQTILRQPCSLGAWWSMITKVSRAVATGGKGQTVETLTCGNTEVLVEQHNCQSGWMYICACMFGRTARMEEDSNIMW